MSAELDTALSRIETLARGRGLDNLGRGGSGEQPELVVGDRPFARLLSSKTLMLPCPEEQKALLLDISPTIYFESDDLVGQSAVLIHLDKIDNEELSLRLDDAWRYVTPD